MLVAAINEWLRPALSQQTLKPLDGAACDAFEAFQHGEEMPAAIVTGEGVHLVHHDRRHPAQQVGVIGLHPDEHGFEGFRRGEQEVRRIDPDTAPL